jgi:hypothetical protein
MGRRENSAQGEETASSVGASVLGRLAVAAAIVLAIGAAVAVAVWLA